MGALGGFKIRNLMIVREFPDEVVWPRIAVVRGHLSSVRTKGGGEICVCLFLLPC